MNATMSIRCLSAAYCKLHYYDAEGIMKHLRLLRKFFPPKNSPLGRTGCSRVMLSRFDKHTLFPDQAADPTLNLVFRAIIGKHKRR